MDANQWNETSSHMIWDVTLLRHTCLPSRETTWPLRSPCGFRIFSGQWRNLLYTWMTRKHPQQSSDKNHQRLNAAAQQRHASMNPWELHYTSTQYHNNQQQHCLPLNYSGRLVVTCGHLHKSSSSSQIIKNLMSEIQVWNPASPKPKQQSRTMHLSTFDVENQNRFSPKVYAQ